MNDGQVALHTSQAVKEGLSRVSEEYRVVPDHQSGPTAGVDGNAEQTQSENTHDLQGDTVVDEDIGVACRSCSGGARPSPPLEAFPEDEDVDREEEEEVGTGEEQEGCGSNGAIIANKVERIEGGV